MKIAARSLASLGLAAALLSSPARAAEKSVDKPAVKHVHIDPTNAVLERISVDSSSILGSTAILQRLGVKSGQVLTPAVLSQIAAQLRSLPIPQTFRYVHGEKSGQIALLIKDSFSTYADFRNKKSNVVEEGC